MKCQDVDKLIYKYCDGRVSPKISQRVALHLNSCNRCHNIYQLTMIENEILAKKDDIPSLSPAFTSMLIGSLKTSGTLYGDSNAVKTKEGSSSRFNRKIWLSSLTAAAAVIALLVYLPYHTSIPGGLNIFDRHNYANQEQPSVSMLGSELYDSSDSDQTTRLYNDSLPTDPKEAMPASETDNEAVSEALSSQAKSQPINKPTEAVASNISTASVDSTISGASVASAAVADLSLRPKNIPDRLKFVQVNNNMENNTVFNYASLDGKEYLQLTVAPYIEQTSLLRSASDPSSQGAVTFSRVIQNGGSKIKLIVSVSGNLQPDELTTLANNIRF